MKLSKIVFFTHPTFLNHQSMPRFAKMIMNGMQVRGYEVQEWSAFPFWIRLAWSEASRKWLGYIDQYIVFSLYAYIKVLFSAENVLYVITDNALGPFVPIVSKKKHIIHCHDFLAQHSALGLIIENPTSSTGKIYQWFIRKGFSRGCNFLSVSYKTKSDLEGLLGFAPNFSNVLYNGLNQKYMLNDKSTAREYLSNYWGINLTNGFFLHVGGNQWYKNREGVLQIYIAWRKKYKVSVPLILIGQILTPDMSRLISESSFRKDIYSFNNVQDDLVKMAYSGANMLLFPSLAEGFGWPIIEAMASGCIVVTTNEEPMREVAGDAAFYINKKPSLINESVLFKWADQSADVVNRVFDLSATELEDAKGRGLNNVKRFDSDKYLDNVEKIYLSIWNNDFKTK